MSSPTILRLPFSLAKLIYRSMTRTWQLFRDAKIGQIYEGTSNMQLATIAKMLIGR